MSKIASSNLASPIGEVMVKSKKKVEEVEPYRVYLIYDEETHGGGVCRGDEDSDWPNHNDEYNTFTPKGLRLKPPEWSETIEVDFDPTELDHLYIVVVRYSSGSTFGRTHGHWHIEGAYKTYDEAEKIEMAISKGTGWYDPEKDYGDRAYPGRTGMPWVGYFESLEGATVERLDVWK